MEPRPSRIAQPQLIALLEGISVQECKYAPGMGIAHAEKFELFRKITSETCSEPGILHAPAASAR